MFVVSVVVAGLWIAAPAHGPGVSADLMSQAQEQGHVRIIVKVARDAPAGETIEAAQDAVLNELVGTSFKVLHQYINSAFLALDVGPDALETLGRSRRIESIAADFDLEPMRQPRTP